MVYGFDYIHEKHLQKGRVEMSHFDAQLRRVVAVNKTMPRHVLESLQNHDDVSVKKVAQRTLNA